jgi:hypothetical protein
MKPNPFAGKTRPSLPTLSDIQRRIVELTGNPLQLEPQTQLQTRPARSTPWPPSQRVLIDRKQIVRGPQASK